MTIAAESEGTPDFKGFMVTARDAHDRIVGTIASNDSLHTVFCWGAVSTLAVSGHFVIYVGPLLHKGRSEG